MNQKKWISWGVRLGSLSLVAGMVSYLSFTHKSVQQESTAVDSQEQSNTDVPYQSNEEEYNYPRHHRSAFGPHSNRQYPGNGFGSGSNDQYSDDEFGSQSDTPYSGDSNDSGSNNQFPEVNKGPEQSNGYDTTTRGT
jgi:hypothetical protein